MEKLYLDGWFKLPPKRKKSKYVVSEKGAKKRKHGESYKKAKK